MGGHEGCAVVSGLCCAVLCRAVPRRGAGCSPLTTPPARAQAAGSVCWRLCAFQFVGHSPSKPLRGQRQLGAVTNNPRAPVTPAPGAACQLWGGGAWETAPCSPGVLEGSSGVVLGGPTTSNREGGTCRAGFLAGGGSDRFLGSSGERRRNAVVTSALGTGYGVGRWQWGIIHDPYGKGWWSWPGTGKRTTWAASMRWLRAGCGVLECASEPSRGVPGSGGVVGVWWERSAAWGGWAVQGRSALARCSHSTLLQCFAH